MKIKSLALAVAGLCAAGGVSAQTLTINAGGASATRATITNAIVETACGTSGITWFQQGTNVTRITCPINATLAAGLPSTFTNLDFSYDNTTGSYLGVGPVSGNGQNVLRLNIGAGTTCAAGGNVTVAGKTVLNRTGCGVEATGVRPVIGNADVEPDMFTGPLAPAAVGPFNPAGVQSVTGQFGIIFGITASLPLYRALQAEQGLTQNDLEANAPTLSTAQIVSLTSANGGPLNSDWSVLFPNTNPAGEASAVRFSRRVAGSGSHATFSSQFLATNCAGLKALNPASAGDSSGTYTVLEYGATGNQIASVDSVGPFPTISAAQGSSNAVALNGTPKGADYYAMGYASLENAPAASGNGSGWRFVKVDGLYPSKANVQNGRYNWMAEQVLTLAEPTVGPTNFGMTANSLAAAPGFFSFLASATGSSNVIAGFNATVRAGVVALPGIADSSEANYAAQRTRFRTLGNSCVRPFAIE